MRHYHSCMVCASRQGQYRSGIALLTPIPLMVKPMEQVAMDILMLSMMQSGDKYLLVIVDTFTKFCWAFPMPNQEAETVISAFLKVLAFGTPAHVLMDRGMQFTSKLFTSLCNQEGHQLSQGHIPLGTIHHIWTARP